MSTENLSQWFTAAEAAAYLKVQPRSSEPRAVLIERRRVKRARKPKAVRKEARGTWVFFPIINGKRTTRTLGLLKDLTQKQADQKAEQMLRDMKLRNEREAPTVSRIVEQYRIEKMPQRHDTRRSYDAWLRNHILPTWGKCVLADLGARPGAW